MKKAYRLAMLIIALLLASSCTQSPETTLSPSPSEGATISPSSSPSESPSPSIELPSFYASPAPSFSHSISPPWTTPTSNSTAPTELTDAEIKALYEKASDAFFWFYNIPPSNVDLSKPGVEIDGIEYYEINAWEYKSLVDFEKYLKTIFSEEFVAKMLGPEHTVTKYPDVNGVLHCNFFDLTSNINAGEETHTIIRLNEYRTIYRVDKEKYDDNETKFVIELHTYDFYLEYINDKWVFVNFDGVQFLFT